MTTFNKPSKDFETRVVFIFVSLCVVSNFCKSCHCCYFLFLYGLRIDAPYHRARSMSDRGKASKAKATKKTGASLHDGSDSDRSYKPTSELTRTREDEYALRDKATIHPNEDEGEVSGAENEEEMAEQEDDRPQAGNIEPQQALPAEPMQFMLQVMERQLTMIEKQREADKRREEQTKEELKAIREGQIELQQKRWDREDKLRAEENDAQKEREKREAKLREERQQQEEELMEQQQRGM